jgi:hypothetical protein
VVFYGQVASGNTHRNIGIGSAMNLKQRSICFNQCADGYYHRFKSCPDNNE